MRTVMLAAGAGCLAIAASAATLAAATPVPPPKDRFHGRIVSGSGALKHDRGTVAIDVAAPATGQATRSVSLAFTGGACGKAARCVRLTGTLRGTITDQPHTVPDVGAVFTIRASGRVRPLGRVSTTGTVHGTGFIARGHETMQLTLTARRGNVTLSATSALVAGFTSP